MRVFTIGFTQKSAAQFFSMLQAAGVRRVLDTRLNNRSQLAGFSKGEDLRYFLKTIAAIDYRYATEMAPTEELLHRYKKLKGSWAEYESAYRELLVRRDVVRHLVPSELDHACLLCSEHEPTHCHRRLAAEFLREQLPTIEIVHLIRQGR
jgi:uncharacterized protein (DUF488 family)